MKKLRELYDIDSDIEIYEVKINSRDCKKGDIFVCTSGVNADRHDFVDDAIKNGASCIVASRDIGKKSVPVIMVDDTNKELPILARKLFDNPEEKLTMIGVTGTDGKTTTTTIIQTLIGKDKCGYIGTNGRSYKDKVLDTSNTTPDADKLYMYLDEFVKAGCSYASMEASSEAFYRGRLQGLMYDISVITNITPEHLNIHGSIENYIECKSMLFSQTKKDGYCILNSDDKYFYNVKEKCNGKVLSYGEKEGSTLQIINYEITPRYTNITYKYNGENLSIKSPLLGKFNIYNLAAALLVCFSLGYKLEDIIDNLKDLNVDGRMQLLDTNTPYYVMVDYAHTPNGIENLLDFVKTLNINKSIVVIGSAGERDPYKRPVMGKTVCDNASYAIFTYEDPRSEDPVNICNDLIRDIKDDHDNYEIVIDRHDAIKKAVNMAGDNDMVLILGKGNETYQKLKNETIYFNDVKEALDAVLERENND